MTDSGEIQPHCNIEHAHEGPCGAEDCWWLSMIAALDRTAESGNSGGSDV